MNTEKQRIAIAEACGWKAEHHHQFRGAPIWTHSKRPCMWCESKDLPDYLNDLNAMHEAEKTLKDWQWDEYANWHLRCAVAYTKDRSIKCSVHPMPQELRGLIQANAAQRADGFLHTIGKWEDET